MLFNALIDLPTVTESQRSQLSLRLEQLPQRPSVVKAIKDVLGRGVGRSSVSQNRSHHAILEERNRQIAGVLGNFIRTIEDAGGVIRKRQDLIELVADRVRIEFGEAYSEACQVLGRSPPDTDVTS